MLLIVFLVCLISTVLGAVTGIGGGVIIKPVLDGILPLGASTVSFLSGCTVLAMSGMSIWLARKSLALLNLRQATLLAVSGAAGGLAGKQLMKIVVTQWADERMLGLLQNSVLLLLTVGVFCFVLGKSKISMQQHTSTAAYLIAGLALGVFSSFLGIGGGPINLAVLTYFFSLDTKKAALLSLYIILFSQIASLAVTLATGAAPAVDPLMLGLMAVGGVSGGLFGSQISRRLNNRGIDRVFLGMMCLIMVLCLLNIARAVAAL